MIVKTPQQYPWQFDKPFNDFSYAVKKKYGSRMQKISIDAGFTCPNRDGTKSNTGCTFCNNTFKPFYCSPQKSVGEQIDQGIEFFEKKYPDAGFLAFFQDYSNTYAPLEILEEVYSHAVLHPKVDGLVISTRPDCVSEDTFELLRQINTQKMVWIEFGVESTLDKTLTRINRHHSFEEVKKSMELAHDSGLNIGAHLMLGLPGETREDFLNHAIKINALPINRLKIHQLQVLKNTQMAIEFRDQPGDFIHWSLEDYMEVIIEFLERLRPDIEVERFLSHSPKESIIYPKWGTKNDQFTRTTIENMLKRGAYQGKNYENMDH